MRTKDVPSFPQPQLKAMPDSPPLPSCKAAPAEPSVTPQTHKQQRLYTHTCIIPMNSIYRVTEQGDRTWRIKNSKWGTVVITRCKLVMIRDRHVQSFVNKGANRPPEPCPGLCRTTKALSLLSLARAKGKGGQWAVLDCGEPVLGVGQAAALPDGREGGLGPL